ncbi:M23 family metallopeptidase [Paenibacillus sp. PL2-23]|uniref:M23 family metallopeptidase n=1 Tax=Paenibacillus sp. PL2-23 TaxID=2100729 RepID=UPI0030FAE0F0
MGIRDDVKLRRQQKIRNLQHHYQGYPPDESQHALERAAAEEDRIVTPTPSFPRSAQDPELVWKNNPNPWEGWDTGSFAASGARGYIQSQHTDDFEPPRGGGWSSLRKALAWKLIVSAALFGGIWMLFELDHPLAKQGQQLITEAMTDEMNLDAVALWYKDVFAGAPSFIPLFEEKGGGAALVDGQPNTPIVAPIEEAAVVRTFAELLNGIELAGASGATVFAAETGRVIQVTEQGDSVLIQHANDRITIYGKLASASVSVNDWVEAGQPIGSLQTAVYGDQSFLLFAVKQNDRYVDPLDVIPLD